MISICFLVWFVIPLVTSNSMRATSAKVAALATFCVNSLCPGESIKMNCLFLRLKYLNAISIVIPCCLSSIKPSSKSE